MLGMNLVFIYLKSAAVKLLENYHRGTWGPTVLESCRTGVKIQLIAIIAIL